MTSLAAAADKFLRHIAVARRLSSHTCEDYQRDLRLLTDHLGERDVASIGAGDLQKLLATRRGASPATLARQIAAWRAFFEFLNQAETLTDNPARRLVAPKKDAPLPKALTPDDMKMFLDGAPGGDAASGRAQSRKDADGLAARDAAIMELLYASALRLSELVALDISDVDFGGGVVHVRRGKGGAGRAAPLGATAAAALRVWLSLRKTWLGGAIEPALFVGINRRRLGARAVQKRIDRRALQTGFVKPVHPHVFRHSCATHFLQSSGDIRATQELLGHKALAATQIYTKLDYQRLAETYDRAHPRAKK